MRRAALVLLLIGCRDKSVPPVVDAAAPAASLVVDSGAPTVKRFAARDIVDQWNEAHVKHDAKALEGLYGAKVKFYGQTLSGKDCAARKAAAFAKSRDYTQAIKDVDSKTEGSTSTVTFTKTSTEKGKSTDYPAILVVVGNAITAETDKVTDANLAAREAASQMWCMEEPWMPNDKVIAPYKLSALDAARRGRMTKHFHELEVAAKATFLDFGQITCPTKCEPATRECGYDLRIEDHSAAVAETPAPHSNLVGWAYIDAVTGVMYWNDGKDSEPLPLLPR